MAMGVNFDLKKFIRTEEFLRLTIEELSLYIGDANLIIKNEDEAAKVWLP